MIEYALVLPIALLLILALLQTAMYFHAANAASHAADRAVQVSQVLGGAASDGQAAAHQVLSQTAALSNTQVEVARGETIVTARISGQSQSLVFGWSPTVTTTAEGPVERWTDP